MRISPWALLLAGWVLAAAVGPAAYAVEPGDEFSEFAPPANSGDFETGGQYQPVQYAAPGNAGMPAYGGAGNAYYGGGAPPNAWPGISPYAEPELRETYNSGGLWQYEDHNEGCKYLFSAEMLITWGLRPGDQLIGATGVPALQYDQGTPNIFPHQTAGSFSNLTHYGAKLRYGWENVDDSKFIISGFYVAQSSQSKGPLGNLLFPIGDNLQTIASIPFNNGYDGTLATYDLTWYQNFSQEFWGADADMYVSPFLRRDNFKVAFTYGVKYLRINEGFNVRARNSNETLTVDVTSGAVTAATNTGLPQTDFQINSFTISDLVGPSMGLRYDLGGDVFKIWGQTKFALAVDMDHSHVYGQNAVTIQDVTNGVQVPLYFDATKSHTHVVPVFDQSIYGEFPLFQVLPLINRLSFINKANFRIGWNYVCAWEVARPANQIRYDIYSPSIQTDRTWISLSTLSFAADWRY